MIFWDKPYDRPENGVGVRLLGWTNLAITRLYHHVNVIQPPNVPRSGPAILVSNHISGLDPLFIQSCVNRLVIWMTAREYYEAKGLGWVYKTIQAIPVDRSGRDMAATRAALRALKNGRILGIFPEGKIETTRDMLPFQTGVAMLAIRAKVPVLPVYVDGTQRGKEMLPAFASPNKAKIAFGPPVEFDRTSTHREALEASTEKIRDAINILANRVDARL